MNISMRFGAAYSLVSMLSASVLLAVVPSEPSPITTTAAPVPSATPESTVSSSPMVIAQPSAATVLPQGTMVRLRTLSQLSSQENKVGERFDLEVAEDVLLNGRVVIPRGSPAVGDVTLVKKKGMWGKSGKLEARVLSVRANGKDIPVRGTVGDKGETGTAAVVGSILVLPVAGFFVTGTSAVMPSGTGAMAMLESDLPVQFEAPTPPGPASVVPIAPAAASQLR
jgi:hypothetical protein